MAEAGEAEELKAIFAKLGFPGILKFRAAVKKAGLDAPIRTLKQIVAEASQRQVLAKEPKYLGKVVVDALHSRWAADLISYVSQPTADGFTHVLVVQDIFSRKIWTRALPNAQAKGVSAAFINIITVSGRICKEINTDAGNEFVTSEFNDMLEEKGIRMHRVSDSKNDIATFDRSIGSLTNQFTKMTNTIGTAN